MLDNKSPGALAEARFNANLQADTGSGIIPGLKTLRLRKAERRIKVKFQREMWLVDSRLVALFRELIVGKARWPLYLYGPSGAGKTAAALCLCDFAASAVFTTPDDLCELAKRDDAPAEWARIAEKELAVLDELGERENVADFPYAATKRFADLREQVAGRVGIYIANLTPTELQEVYDDRITSRILCGCRFELKGDDRRFQ